jgi:hypothetical protein
MMTDFRLESSIDARVDTGKQASTVAVRRTRVSRYKFCAGRHGSALGKRQPKPQRLGAWGLLLRCWGQGTASVNLQAAKLTTLSKARQRGSCGGRFRAVHIAYGRDNFGAPRAACRAQVPWHGAGGARQSRRPTSCLTQASRESLKRIFAASRVQGWVQDTCRGRYYSMNQMLMHVRTGS